jgi:hypothetical protein
MSAICAFETFEYVSNRRIADVADHGLGRLDWADSGPSRPRCNGKNAHGAGFAGRFGERVKSDPKRTSKIALMNGR